MQTTTENIKVLLSAVREMVPEGYANHGKAFEFAFKLLEHVSSIGQS